METETTQTVLDAFLHVETRIEEISQLLLDTRPDTVDRCHNELQQIAAMLEGVAIEGESLRQASISSALLRIRRSVKALRLQIDYASNLCFGWIQLRLGTGYTERGLPVLAAAEPASSFEG